MQDSNEKMIKSRKTNRKLKKDLNNDSKRIKECKNKINNINNKLNNEDNKGEEIKDNSLFNNLMIYHICNLIKLKSLSSIKML